MAERIPADLRVSSNLSAESPPREERTLAGRMPADLRPSSTSNTERVTKKEERILEELASAGLVTRGEGALTSFRPLRIAGKPLSETLLEDRNDRL